jgi:hypothetical protein
MITALLAVPIWVLIIAVVLISALVSLVVGGALKIASKADDEIEVMRPEDLCDHEWVYSAPGFSKCKHCGEEKEK